jgi:hypothetical protein
MDKQINKIKIIETKKSIKFGEIITPNYIQNKNKRENS